MTHCEKVTFIDVINTKLIHNLLITSFIQCNLEAEILKLDLAAANIEVWELGAVKLRTDSVQMESRKQMAVELDLFLNLYQNSI